jgi:hypothetical protein
VRYFLPFSRFKWSAPIHRIEIQPSIIHGFKENADVFAASRAGGGCADLRVGFDSSCGE